jgi:alpha-soluble NSF attachment protein
MGDHEARGHDFEKKAEKKLSGWAIFGSKYEDAADLFDKAANSFKLAKNCERPLLP